MNLRKFTVFSVLVALVISSLVACASPEAATETTEQEVVEEEAAEEVAEEEQAADATEKPVSEMRVALMATGTLGGDPNADDMAAGLQRAVDEFGLKEGTTYETLDPQVFEESIRSFAQEGYDMVIVPWPSYTEVLTNVAPDFPDVKFVQIYNAGHDYEMPNVVAVDFACWESNYACGVVASMISETGKLGHIVGSEDDNIVANYNAYVKGAQSINPDATVERINANSFTDAAKGKEIALSMYNNGIDVILGDAATTTLGMIEAAVETDNFIIGDAVDHSSYGPGNLVMDTFLGFGNAVYEQVKLLATGEWKPGLAYATYANNGIGTIKNTTVGENNPKLAPIMDDVWAKLEEVEAQITSGELVIERDTSK